MKNFALIGSAGYIAKRHVEAIKINNSDLIMMCDPNDNVGYIDKYFPNALYFREIERFDRELNRKQEDNKIDFVSICSPNYLHDSHIRLAIRNHCNVICEKPLVLKKEHLDMLRKLEINYEKKIYTILQLRHHKVIIDLKKKVENSNLKHKVELEYITPRGKWYEYSWKGDFDKSGGILFNIGVHFFDMLIWIFGDVQKFECNQTKTKAEGVLNLKKAEVKFKLSINKFDLPYDNWEPYRYMNIDNNKFNFSEGFTDLHTASYKHILNSNGYGIEDIYPAIELIEQMVNSD